MIPDEHAQSVGGKCIIPMLWYGYSRTLFTYAYVEQLLESAGYSEITKCDFRETASAFPEIVALDNGSAESLVVEARK